MNQPHAPNGVKNKIDKIPSPLRSNPSKDTALVSKATVMALTKLG